MTRDVSYYTDLLLKIILKHVLQVEGMYNYHLVHVKNALIAFIGFSSLAFQLPVGEFFHEFVSIPSLFFRRDFDPQKKKFIDETNHPYRLFFSYFFSSSSLRTYVPMCEWTCSAYRQWWRTKGPGPICSTRGSARG